MELPLYKNIGSPSLIYLIRNLLYAERYYFTLRKHALKPKAHFPYVDKMILFSGPYCGLGSYTTVLIVNQVKH